MSPSCSAPNSMPSLSAAAPWLPVTRLARSPSQNCEMTASCGRKRKITREAERQALLPGSPASRRTARNTHPIRHARPRPRWAESTRWDARVIQVWSAILIVAGALILAVELKPPRVTRLRLHAGHQATDAALTRGGLAGTLRAAATSIDGITGAAVTVRRGRAVVAARAAARGRAAAGALKQPVTDAVRSRLDGLDMNPPPHLKVRVTAGSR